jgi:hypothetical protein
MDVPVAIQVLKVDDDMVMSFVPVWPTY